MTKEALEIFETELKAKLVQLALAEKSIHDPITDGVVDFDRYLASCPRMLWILKEPWEELAEGVGGGDWSVKSLITKGLTENRGLYANMAYITYSVFNGFLSYSDLPRVTDDSNLGDSLKAIGYININKFPGKKRSSPPKIAAAYQRNRSILLDQITTYNPDVIIGGGTLRHFFNDFELKDEDFKHQGSASYVIKDGRLYIDAYHPSYWSIKPASYVDDVVCVIKQLCRSQRNHIPDLITHK